MGSKLLNEFELLWNIISDEKKGRDVYYMPNPGNWGDGLIRDATILFFNDKNLKYRTILPKKSKYYYLKQLLLIRPFRQRLLIYGGGGGWTNLWGYPYRLLQKRIFTLFFSKIIVLPSTYEIFLEDDKIVYFSRDRFQSQMVNQESIFCHDMAFYLISLDKANLETSNGNEIKKGYFFRTDKESRGSFPLPEENFDISFCSDYEESYVGFLSIINKYEEIYTDRLHVAIASCILDKKLHFWEGSYFKNEAVFKSSMSFFKRKYFETDSFVKSN